MDLIKLSEDNKEFPVDSRDLYKALQVRSEHYHWIARRLDLFVEDEHYVVRDVSSEKVFMLSLNTAKHFAMLEKNDKGEQVRQWFIQKAEEKSSAPQITSNQMFLHIAQQMVEQEKRALEQERRLSQVERAVSFESIHQLVQDSLKEETINVFPRDCSRLESIRELVFTGISEAVISKYLHHINHPTKEYTFKMEDNVLRSITVFDNNGLADAYNRFRSESVYEKTTPKNIQFKHPVVGNYRVKR